MPNPTIPPQPFTPASREPTGHNGILGLVPGPIVAAGSKSLPPAGPKWREEYVVLLDVPDLGRVRITYHLSSYSHRRSKFWVWRAVWAEAA